MDIEIETFLTKIADQLDEWADSAERYSSTQHVEPMRRKADEIRRFIWRTKNKIR